MPARIITASQIRTVAMYQAGLDLVERMRTTEQIVAAQRQTLEQAADEIDRLNARVKELEACVCKATNSPP